MRVIIGYPGSRTVTETFDKRFRLQSVLDGSGNGVAQWVYDLANRRTDATLGNDVTSAFTHDLDSRLTRIQHADEWSNDLFDVQHGYDAVGNRLWTHDNLRAGRDELYTYDRLNRLRGFTRGTLNAERDALTALLDHPYLPNEQSWATLDRNGNWAELDESIGVPQVTVDEYRSANAVNAYLTIAFGANPAQNLTHDANGNLTLDPTARNVSDTPGSPTGQTYEYDEENLLTAVRRASDEELLQGVTYDALGRRIETIDYTGVNDPCGDESSPVITRHVYGVLETLIGIRSPSALRMWTAWFTTGPPVRWVPFRAHSVSQMLAQNTSQQFRPRASERSTPVIRSAAALNDVIRQSRSTVNTPSATESRMT